MSDFEDLGWSVERVVRIEKDGQAFTGAESELRERVETWARAEDEKRLRIERARHEEKHAPINALVTRAKTAMKNGDLGALAAALNDLAEQPRELRAENERFVQLHEAVGAVMADVFKE